MGLSQWTEPRVEDRGRSTPYRDLGLCANPVRQKNRFLGILGADISRWGGGGGGGQNVSQENIDLCFFA